MSKISDSIKAIRAFSKALWNCSQSNDPEALREGLTLAQMFVDRTANTIQSIAANPWGIAWTILMGGTIDPFADLRPAADAFTAKWLTAHT